MHIEDVAPKDMEVRMKKLQAAEFLDRKGGGTATPRLDYCSRALRRSFIRCINCNCEWVMAQNESAIELPCLLVNRVNHMRV